MAAGPTSDAWAAVRETHSGCVVLLGDRAFKLKKPVALGFLDFTDRTTRRRVCEHEVSLNRRLAPDVYLGVGNLVTPDGVAEPVVVMRRLPESARLSRLVREGADLTTDVQRIARVLAAFHSGAARSPEIAANGSRQAILSRWDASFEQTRPHAGTMLPAPLLEEVETLVHRFLAGREELFADRIRRGAVVDGHGDLTADDVFCMADGPRLLDCLEFDDTLRHLDRLDDVAFLAMGLEALGAPQLGQVLLDEWAELVGDPAPPALVHHFVAYRAFVRAKVACFSGAQLDRPASDQVTSYATMARDHLRSGAVTLVLVGGPPGVGKTTLAVHVAERLGMVVISSDRLRKEAAGIDPQTPAAAAFASGIYSPVHTRATYAEMLRRAGLLLHRGESVVLDASWTDDAERRLAATTAELAHADLVSFRCHLDREVAAARIRGRAREEAPHRSDADEVTAEHLRRLEDPWPGSTTIDMRPSPEACADEACARLRPTRAPATLLRRRPRLAPG